MRAILGKEKTRKLMRRGSSLNDEIIDKSHFHQLRKYEKEQMKIKAREEAKRLLKLKQKQEASLLEGIEEVPKENITSEDVLLKDSASQVLQKVEEEESEDLDHDEA